MEQSKYKYLLSQHQYGRFNYNFAKIVGIKAAAYFTELYEQSVNDDKEYFIPKYTKLQDLLNISKEEQESYIGAFVNLQVVQKQDKYIKLDLDTYINMILNDSAEFIEDQQKKATEGSTKIINGKVDKSNSIRNRLKYQILGNNEEVRKCYFRWIDALVDKFGSLPNETVILGQKMASNYAKGNTSIEKAVIEKAIINVYKDMSWAIQSFEKTLTIEGNLASAKPVTLSQPMAPKDSEDDNVSFKDGVV